MYVYVHLHYTQSQLNICVQAIKDYNGYMGDMKKIERSFFLDKIQVKNLENVVVSFLTLLSLGIGDIPRFTG